MALAGLELAGSTGAAIRRENLVCDYGENLREPAPPLRGYRENPLHLPGCLRLLSATSRDRCNTPMSATAPPKGFLVRDHRRPGQSLIPLALKLPPEAIEAIDALAAQHQVTRGAAGRALLLHGLEQLQQEAAA